MTFKYYWEDFQVGDSQIIGRRVIDQSEMIEFAREFDPQPFHVDEVAAKTSFFGGIIASGWHTCSIVMRMMCDSYLNESASFGSPGLDNIRWLKPVRPGDEITARRIVVESRASASRPAMGLVKTRWEIHNQNGELVLTMEGYGMFQRRSAASGA